MIERAAGRRGRFCAGENITSCSLSLYRLVPISSVIPLVTKVSSIVSIPSYRYKILILLSSLIRPEHAFDKNVIRPLCRRIVGSGADLCPTIKETRTFYFYHEVLVTVHVFFFFSNRLHKNVGEKASTVIVWITFVVNFLSLAYHHHQRHHQHGLYCLVRYNVIP